MFDGERLATLIVGMQTHYISAMIESVITAKSQTTLPSGVRKALGLRPGDRLTYIVEGDRAVIMKAPADESGDPVVAAFLGFLERDMEAHPERLAGLTPDLLDRARELADGVEVDLDAPIEGDVAI